MGDQGEGEVYRDFFHTVLYHWLPQCFSVFVLCVALLWLHLKSLCIKGSMFNAGQGMVV